MSAHFRHDGYLSWRIQKKAFRPLDLDGVNFVHDGMACRRAEVLLRQSP